MSALGRQLLLQVYGLLYATPLSTICVSLATEDCLRHQLMHRSHFKSSLPHCLFFQTGLSGLCRVTEYLFLSNGKAAKDCSQVTGNGITCIINATETRSSSPPPPGVEYIHIPVSDSPLCPLGDHFDQVADKIRFTAEANGRTLVHCNAGVSRSAALCLAYLMKHRGATLLEAHRLLKSCRPIVRPNPGFWRQLIQYEAGLRGSSTVRMVPSSLGEIPNIYEEETRNMVLL